MHCVTGQSPVTRINRRRNRHMDPFHFTCPHCSAPLRVREKLLVGRQIDCPECGRPLVIADRAGELAAEPVATKIADRREIRGAGTPPPRESDPRPTFLRRPAWVAIMGLAAILMIASVAFLLRPRGHHEIAADGRAPVDVDKPAGGDGEDRASSEDRHPQVADDYMIAEEMPLADDADSARRPETEVDVGAAFSDDDDQPIDPEFAPEPTPARRFDLAVSLRQPIARFDQPRSKPLEEVLVSVAEMAGTRITFNREDLGPAAARLAEPMALKQDDTTVGEILTGLLRPAGLAYRIEGDHLRLVRAE